MYIYKFLVFFILLLTIFCTLFPAQTLATTITLNDTLQLSFEFSGTVNHSAENRAVAFHSITFIDSLAHPTAEIIFGTSETNLLQGGGWFTNNISSVVGTYQWAGGTNAQADMQIVIPPASEGMLLKITSVADSLWMTVRINNLVVGTLRVDSYWHSGYVAVGTAVPEPASGVGPVWSPGRYFPKFPATDRVYVIPVRTSFSDNTTNTWNHDWRINHSFHDMMALTLVSMQGLINRNRPRVYFDWNETFANSAFWIPLMAEHIEVIELDLDALSAVNFLMRRFAYLFDGSVIYDPEVPETINLATMIAGEEDRLILAPEQMGLPGLPMFDNNSDIRQLVQSQGWDTSVTSQTSIYQWVYDNLLGSLEHRIMGFISPGPPTSRALNQELTWPLNLAQRDYYIALGLSAIYLDPVIEPQASLLEQYFSQYPSPIPVSGGFSFREAEFTSFISNYGDWQTALSWPGEPLAAGNLSVFSGIETGLTVYEPEMNAGRIFATLGERPVATMFCTDGDNLEYLVGRGFHDFFVWEDVQNQNFGWTINPTLAELAPLVWNYYMESAMDVSFITGLSGAGYMYPQDMSIEQIDAFLAYTRRYQLDTGLRTIRADDRQGPWTAELATRYYDALNNTGYLGTIVGYTGGSRQGLNVDYYGVPVPTTRPTYAIRGQNEQVVVNAIMSQTPGVDFIDINYAINPVCLPVADAMAVGGQALLIPPAFSSHEACCLATSTPAISLAPGEYTAIFRMKVPDNQDTEPVAVIYSGILSDDWTYLASQSIAPSDFQQAGEYQDFSLQFSLDTLTSGFECRVDHWMGTQTDLYVDYFQITRIGGPALQSFNTVLVPLIITVEEMSYQNSAPGRFTEAFEAQGGIVLTPDEYLAALNPQYMIDFATPILGPGHTAIREAQQQLTESNFLGSLITIRDALKPQVASAIRVDPEETVVAIAARDSVTISIDDVTAIGSSRFDLTYDPDIIRVDSVITGSLLGSSGRPVFISERTIDNVNGIVIFDATTSGEYPGTAGSGDLARVKFTALAHGSTSLLLQNVDIRNIDSLQLTIGSVAAAEITVFNSTGIEQQGKHPTHFDLSQNYPNPFNPSTTIKFALPTTETVKIEVYNLRGMRVATLLDKPLAAGYHQVEFNPQRLASGVYIYLIRAGHFRMTKKMVYLK
jgi:hypothetical protein